MSLNKCPSQSTHQIKSYICAPVGFCPSQIRASKTCLAVDLGSHILVLCRLGLGPSPSSLTIIPGSSTSILNLSSGSGLSSSPELRAYSMADRCSRFGLMALQRGGGAHISPCLSLHSSALQTCGPGDEEHASPSRESSQGGLGPPLVLRPARESPFT